MRGKKWPIDENMGEGRKRGQIVSSNRTEERKSAGRPEKRDMNKCHVKKKKHKEGATRRSFRGTLLSSSEQPERNVIASQEG